jgi:hypothetical protein
VKTVLAAPSASILIESMRDIGYSLETALADVIDNSITAGASTVEMLADTSGADPKFAIVDDGSGMTYDELIQAMRLGSQNPLDPRTPDDLGRFGLGLKTASFSQCRRLTVVSRQAGTTVCARWDLDRVAETNDWTLEIPDDEADIPWADRLGNSGTLVLWEEIDRLIDAGDTDRGNRYLVNRLNDAIEHLELIFHRFLSGEKGLPKVSIKLNNHPLRPFDPFHSAHPATISGPPEKIRVGSHEVTLQTFTLPHHKKVTPAEWERYAGKAGYVKNQGFYVYRGGRLIIHGTWFNLARQMELTKLCRVRIDMPNELDEEWKIDVKKSSAQPPPRVRARLRSIIETIGATSKRVYTARGRRLITDSRLPVWQRVQDKNEISYHLNDEHPVLADFKKRLPSELHSDFAQVLALASSSIPVDALFADISSDPEKVSGDKLSESDLGQIAETTFRHLSSSGLSKKDILDMLQVTEPFRSNWDAVQTMIERMKEQGDA